MHTAEEEEGALSKSPLQNLITISPFLSVGIGIFGTGCRVEA
jgi:hypothetical protein